MSENTDNNNVTHDEDVETVCRICCNLLGKETYCKEKYHIKILNIFLIDIKNDIPHIHPNKICHKCYSTMSISFARQSTTSISPYKNWTQHTVCCELCERIKLLKKGIIGIHKLNFKRKTKKSGRPKNQTKDSLLSQQFFNSLEAQIKCSSFPSQLKFSDINNPKINPHVNLCQCVDCGEILKKPIKILSCEHKFCLACLASHLRGKSDDAQCPKCNVKITKSDIIISTDLQTLLELLKIKCKTCEKTFLINTEFATYQSHLKVCEVTSHKSPMLVEEISTLNEIPRSVEDAALEVLKKKMKLSPNNSLIEFKTGGRVSLFKLFFLL